VKKSVSPIKPDEHKLAHKPTEDQRRQVAVMAELGLRQDEMARIMQISEPTLRKHYDVELTSAKSILNSQVANNLFRIATSSDHKGAVTAAIFWMKTRAKWKETIDLSSEDGTMTPKAGLDVSKLSVETLTEIMRAADVSKQK
jgi:predicted component of type VI protein secretion system